MHLVPQAFVFSHDAVAVLLRRKAALGGRQCDLLAVLVGARHKPHPPPSQPLREPRAPMTECHDSSTAVLLYGPAQRQHQALLCHVVMYLDEPKCMSNGHGKSVWRSVALLWTKVICRALLWTKVICRAIQHRCSNRSVPPTIYLIPCHDVRAHGRVCSAQMRRCAGAAMLSEFCDKGGACTDHVAAAPALT